MKKMTITFIIASTVLMQLIAQEDKGNDKILSSSVSEVVPIDSTTKDELYNRAKVWFAVYYKSSKDVIQLDDKENGKIIGKGVIIYNSPAFSPGTLFSGYFKYVLTVEVKDNKFKYSFENIRHEASETSNSAGSFDNEKPDCGSFYLSKSGWIKIKEQGTDKILEISQDLKTAMSKKSIKNDW
jgi:hypothetical protein